MEMMNMVWLFNLFFLYYYVDLTGAGQESFELINLHDSTPAMLQALSHTNVPVAVSVSHADLKEVSSSVLMAESWLRTHVLTHYPATKITTIVVGHSVLCNINQEDEWGMILPSIKNMYHSLTRWGLEKDIKVSTAFSSDCLHPYSANYRDDLGENVIKPLLNFLQTINSTYSVNPPLDFSLLDDSVSLVSSHLESMKKLGFFELNKVNLIIRSTNERKPMSRKLSFMDSEVVEPYPSRPTPLPEFSPMHSFIGYSVPANIAKKPLPPQASTALPPSLSFPLAPELPPPSMSSSFAPSVPQLPPPFINPSNPPYGYTSPPCNPSYTGGPIAPAPPKKGVEQELWCVAKPSVPAETLQEAMDYACGAGGADCEQIKPHGICYYPDTIVAHASFAFNSYWQKNKKIGGTCNFGGTAMIINSDPSFLHCRFVLS